MARITINLHGTDGDQSVFRSALTEFLAEWPEHATIRDESRGDVYAETYEKMLDAKEHGEHVIIDMDPGMFRMTADQALEAFENIAPGEGFVWINTASPEAIRAHDLTQYESFAENQHRLTAEEAAQGDINDENTRAFFAERGIDTEEN